MVFSDKQDAKLMDVSLKNSDLKFTAMREIMDQKLCIEYKVKIDGDRFKGYSGHRRAASVYLDWLERSSEKNSLGCVSTYFWKYGQIRSSSKNSSSKG